ncbi:ATP-binding cassette domain-containing protein [Desulfovibrio sp. OttesenSCG-928-O18]|nr:ATP-binding cassette domain-containing protein [Desulfovibrio sp. OttesenSCG-928-O18]
MTFSPLRIAVAGVSVTLAGRPALRSVNWALGPGEHWAVLGPNGAGKSTFLRLLRGDVRADQTVTGDTKGTVTWNVEGENDTSPLVIKPVARLVSAEQHRMYVREGWNITGLGLIVSAFTDSLLPSPMDAAMESAATRVAQNLGAAHLLGQRIATMSQGQLRLVLLARAMASAPRLLLLDEPFDGLDAVSRKTLHNAVNAAAATASVVLTAHRARDIPGCVTHALRLEKGRVTQCGQVSEGLPETEPGAKSDAPRVKAISFPPEQKCAADPAAPYALELENADVYVDRAKILHGLTWKLPAGENWRIDGPNGSGKSTLLRLVAGLEHVALGGSLRWFGQEHPPLETRLRETGYLSDLLHATYTYDVTGLDLVLSGFDGSVGLWRKPTRAEREEARQRIDFLGLTPMARTPVSRLSSGTARRFFLARALVGPVRLLLLDEPCSGLDESARDQFQAALDAVLASGVQCLYVSHHDADVPPRVTHELLLDQGRITGTKKRP